MSICTIRIQVLCYIYQIPLETVVQFVSTGNADILSFNKSFCAVLSVCQYGLQQGTLSCLVCVSESVRSDPVIPLACLDVTTCKSPHLYHTCIE